MKLSLYYSIDTWIICLIQFSLMLVMIQVGRTIARNRSQDYADNPGNSAITASLYGLVGLLLAFTFGMSGERFKQRKQTIIEESNAIGTAILRVELYADSVKPDLRSNFRKYLEARIRYYDSEYDTLSIHQSLQDGTLYGNELWKIASRNSRIPANFVASNQMAPALNHMFDIANTRFWGEYERTPPSILTMLFCLLLVTAFTAGYTSAGKGKLDWCMAICFCFFSSFVIFCIIDLDKPRRGIVTLDQQARAIVDLRQMLE